MYLCAVVFQCIIVTLKYCLLSTTISELNFEMNILFSLSDFTTNLKYGHISLLRNKRKQPIDFPLCFKTTRNLQPQTGKLDSDRI